VADAPWRCTQCGTVNEPVANACRTCGRWPSLFELEGSTIEVEEPPAPVDALEGRTVDVETPEPEVFDTDLADVELPPEFEADEEETAPRKPGWQRFARLVVPIGIALYVLASALVNR
jgi:predicted ATP-dependent serine protease